MPISPYLEKLRAHIGHELVLMPGVAGLVRNEAGAVLFQRRTDDGLWGLPAGSVDPGETPAQAVVREVHEETGLVVEAVRVAGVFGGSAFRVQYTNGDVVEYTTIVFECRVVGGTLGGLDDETAELRYFSNTERPSTVPAFPDALFEPQGSATLLFT